MKLGLWWRRLDEIGDSLVNCVNVKEGKVPDVAKAKVDT